MKIKIQFTQDEIAEALREHVRRQGFAVPANGGVDFDIDHGDPGDPRDAGTSISAEVTAEKSAASQR